VRSKAGILAAMIAGALALMATGCGGGGGGSSLPSPYAGSWAGVADVVDGSGTGSSQPSNITLSVDAKGHVNGTWTDPGGSGTITGTVSNGGTATVNILYPGNPADTITGHGVTNIATNGQWQGTLPVSTTGMDGTSLTFQATKQ
jgi:hypothetical protein